MTVCGFTSNWYYYPTHVKFRLVSCCGGRNCFPLLSYPFMRLLRQAAKASQKRQEVYLLQLFKPLVYPYIDGYARSPTAQGVYPGCKFSFMLQQPFFAP